MISRRTLLASLASPLLAQPAQPVIDIHQHTSYSGRSDAELLAHQRDMGITVTVLLPAGSKYGLAAGAGGNDTVVAIARQYPKEYRFFANELPDIPEARPVIERYLKMGALGIVVPPSPKSFSKTAWGLFSTGSGTVGVRQEMVLK